MPTFVRGIDSALIKWSILIVLVGYSVLPALIRLEHLIGPESMVRLVRTEVLRTFNLIMKILVFSHTGTTHPMLKPFLFLFMCFDVLKFFFFKDLMRFVRIF